MSIVKYKLSNGKLAVYESTSYYDPEKKQARPKRKYLGMEDPETGELIPSSKRRGRRSKESAPARNELSPCAAGQQAADGSGKLEQEVKSLAEENRALREQNEALRKEVSQYRAAVESAVALLNALVR